MPPPTTKGAQSPKTPKKSTRVDAKKSTRGDASGKGPKPKAAAGQAKPKAAAAGKQMKKGTKPLPSSVISLVAANDSGSVAQALRTQLQKHHVQFIDLMREWDADGDCAVSRDEFHRAIEHLGFQAPISEVDIVFDSFDGDKSGTLQFGELKQCLLAPVGPDPNLKQKNAEMNERLKQAREHGKVDTHGISLSHGLEKPMGYSIGAAAHGTCELCDGRQAELERLAAALSAAEDATRAAKAEAAAADGRAKAADAKAVAAEARAASAEQRATSVEGALADKDKQLSAAKAAATVAATPPSQAATTAPEARPSEEAANELRELRQRLSAETAARKAAETRVRELEAMLKEMEAAERRAQEERNAAQLAQSPGPESVIIMTKDEYVSQHKPVGPTDPLIQRLMNAGVLEPFTNGIRGRR